MNKTAIKNFAIWARNKLLADIKSKAMLAGITEAGIAEKMPISTQDMEFYDIGTKKPVAISGRAIRQRRELVKVLQKRAQSGDYQTAFQSVIEEVAYTWFNRLIALRFMEVNGYLYDDMRILSSVSPGKVEPDAVTNPFDWNLEFSEAERTAILHYQAENRIDDLFRLLFIAECNALNESLPYLFEKTADYTEFLLTISVTDIDGVVYKLVHDIPEEDFNVELGGQVEIIGWLYQYYNTEPKDKVFADLKKNIKVTKEKIPAATQLFTPDWIVRYMVENSLGRLWLEGHPDTMLQDSWKYYLPEAPQEPEVAAQLAALRKERKALNPENITIIDPCMGSGHILVYAFEVLMDIYRSQGYTDREAAQLIITNNLYGLDIDQRAFQLAYFAVMMCGRKYDRRILTRGLEPNLCAIQESNYIGGAYPFEMGDFLLDKTHQETLNYLLDVFIDAKEYGSLINLEDRDYKGLFEAWNGTAAATLRDVNMSLWYSAIEEDVPPLIRQALIMAQKYDVVVTNPPYMGMSNWNSKLVRFIKNNYPQCKGDLFALFIDKCLRMCKTYLGMMTSYTWLVLASYEFLRDIVLENSHVQSLVQPEYHALFAEANVPICAFVLGKKGLDYKGEYIRLEDFPGADIQAEKYLEAVNNPTCKYRYSVHQKIFDKVPRRLIDYWVSEQNLSAYTKYPALNVLSDVKKGLSTANDEKYLRLWHEIDIDKFGKSKNCVAKWYKTTKGGEFRRWYGNDNYVINWENNGKDIHGFSKAVVRNEKFYFKEGFTWTYITKYKINVRYINNSILTAAGPGIFIKNSSYLHYILGLLNSKVAQLYADNIGGGTMTYEVGEVATIPVFTCEINGDKISNISKSNIRISKDDWTSMELSMDFKCNPLHAAYHLGKPIIIRNAEDDSLLISNAGDGNSGAKEDKTLSQCYEEYKACTNEMFALLKANEEELNRIFIEIYGLQEELTPEVADKDVTIASIFDSKEDIPDSYKGNNYVLTKEDVVKNLISYAVGCLFGRYSLKKPGLIYAGGDWGAIAAENWSEEEFARGIPDNDNVLPITDEAYFEDDIAGRFVRWLADAFGTAHLEENLNFIAAALSVKGANSRDIIRNYFLTGFYKDHVQKYQKRPIYWLYDSGKANGFKALVYMHRYDADTTGRVRMDYLHRMEQTYGDEINRLTGDISEAADNREKARLQKRLLKLQKQAKECQDYDELIGHLALERIVIDLDDGVKANYEKVQTDRNGKKYQILGKI
ncbi:MAG: BREX-1 system adenine-specific DNA-methyltransferase PglX [Anaerovibrio sp.]